VCRAQVVALLVSVFRLCMSVHPQTQQQQQQPQQQTDLLHEDGNVSVSVSVDSCNLEAIAQELDTTGKWCKHTSLYMKC
jgi:hypothetical protein